MAYDRALNLCKKVQGTLSSFEYQYEFLWALHQYNTGKITKNDLEDKVVNVIGEHPDLTSAFKEILEDYEDVGNIGLKKSETDEDLKGKTKRLKVKAKASVSEPVYISPSYRLKPPDYPKTTSSHRSSIASEVLNDTLICVAPSNQNFSNKPRLTSQYEEALNEFEDDKFEFDVLLKNFKSAVGNVRKLLKGVINKEISLGHGFKVEDHLNALNLRCIERMYGYGGPEVLERLHQEPMLALPIIFCRLKEKHKELKGNPSRSKKFQF